MTSNEQNVTGGHDWGVLVTVPLSAEEAAQATVGGRVRLPEAAQGQAGKVICRECRQVYPGQTDCPDDAA